MVLWTPRPPPPLLHEPIKPFQRHWVGGKFSFSFFLHCVLLIDVVKLLIHQCHWVHWEGELRGNLEV